MKKGILLLMFAFIAQMCFGQLSQGDIAFVAFNADGSDDFAFVALDDIPANTSIWFTDNEWTGTAFNNLGEGEIEWSHTSLVSAGTVIQLNNTGSGTLSTNIGTATGGGMNLGASDETILASLEEPSTSVISMTFLAGISNDLSGSGSTLAGTDLVDGTDFIDFDNDHDGFQYTASRTSESSFSDYLPLIMNTSNWQDEASDGTNILPINLTVFTVAVSTPTVGFALASSSVTEGDAGMTNHSIDVTMNLAPIGTVAVGLTTTPGTATAITDYTVLPVPAALTFLTTDTYPYTQSVDVIVGGDTNVESDEDFTVNLAITSGTADVGTTEHTVTITNDDVLPVVGFTTASSSVTEEDAGTSTHTVMVSMDSAPSSDADVDVVSLEDTATEGSDYVAVSSTLTFPAIGVYPMTQNVSITINGDTDIESDETFDLILAMATGDEGLADEGTDAHEVTITNDDTPTVSDVRINEVDANTPGADSAEFIELFGTPNFALDGLVVVLFNGSNDQSYRNWDLDGFSLDANGYFIIGNGISSPEISFTGDQIQNGADAVALYYRSSFLNGTSVTTTDLVDALVYDSDDGDDSGLLTGLGQTDQINENENGSGDTQSIQRGSWFVSAPTPRALNVLPIQLLSFTAKAKNNQTLLSWKTATELNNDYMAIEHSTDGRSFKEIGRVQGAGTSADVQEYQFTDTKPAEGLNYYRLRQVDYDGHTEYHKVVSVMIYGQDGDIRLVPTEVQDEVMLYLPETVNSSADIHIYDISGRLWKTSKVEAGSSQMSLSLSQLAAGHYILHLVNEERVFTVRFNKL